MWKKRLLHSITLMTDETLATDFMVNAHIRIAAREGVPITVRRRGHAASGTIILKINHLNGTADILMQVRYNEERVWTPVSSKGPMSEPEADRYLDKQAEIDPDSWILEIEDKQGRHWFPGRLMK
jgi:hypothetical protein